MARVRVCPARCALGSFVRDLQKRLSQDGVLAFVGVDIGRERGRDDESGDDNESAKALEAEPFPSFAP
jgi:hypothetical protein